MQEIKQAAYAGIDTHKDTNTLALLDELGKVISTKEFATGAKGYNELESMIADSSVLVGIEGANSYGAGIASHLLSCGYQVFEMIRPKREQRRKGKSDPIDAIAAAQNLASGKGLVPKLVADDAKWLMIVREQIVRQMTSISNCIDSMLVTAPDSVRAQYAEMEGECRIRTIAASRTQDVCRRALRMCAKVWLDLKKEADAIEDELSVFIRKNYPNLAGAIGIGTISAARLVVAVGQNPERIGSEAAFSMFCGVSPIPASSGKTLRHRLNRGGDRQANRAIHEIARVRMSCDKRTQEYIAKKTGEGKTKREAMRCLCRYIAREVYHLITGPQVPLPDPEKLASRRKAHNLTQAEVASYLDVKNSTISRAELGRSLNSDLLNAYQSFLDSLEQKECQNIY